MARNRVIPFGYCMKNGEITTEPKEVYAVAEIFREYLNGSSLLQIAKLMESENIRYTEDSDHWNKNMVKRIIENACGLALRRTATGAHIAYGDYRYTKTSAS